MAAPRGYTAADYRALADEGLTATQAAARLGVDASLPGKIAQAHGFTFAAGKRGPKPGSKNRPREAADDLPRVLLRALDHWTTAEAEAAAKRRATEAALAAVTALQPA